MKNFITFFLIVFYSCGGSASVIEEENDTSFFLNCNKVENESESLIYLNIQITTSNNKLFNGSIKGQGLSKDYYKNLDDINKNSFIELEYVFTAATNGEYTFVLFFEDSEKVYTTQCSGEVNNIVKASTSTSTSTSSTTSSTTTSSTTTSSTTTTKPKPKNPEIVFSNCPEEITLPFEIKFIFTVEANSYDISSIISSFNDDVYEYENELWSELPKKGSSTKFTHTFTFYEDTYFSETNINYTVIITYNSGQTLEKSCIVKVIGPFTTTTTTQYFNFDANLYYLTNFVDDYGEPKEGSPFICEIVPDDGSWGRCVSYEKWKTFPSMEKADSNWIEYCANKKNFTTSTWVCTNG